MEGLNPESKERFIQVRTIVEQKIVLLKDAEELRGFLKGGKKERELELLERKRKLQKKIGSLIAQYPLKEIRKPNLLKNQQLYQKVYSSKQNSNYRTHLLAATEYYWWIANAYFKPPKQKLDRTKSLLTYKKGIFQKNQALLSKCMKKSQKSRKSSTQIFEVMLWDDVLDITLYRIENRA